jgi:hypothetical protein
MSWKFSAEKDAGGWVFVPHLKATRQLLSGEESDTPKPLRQETVSPKSA